MASKLNKIFAVNYEDIPFNIREELDDQDMNKTGLYCVDRDTPFGQWLITQDYVFDMDPKHSWGWIGIWN